MPAESTAVSPVNERTSYAVVAPLGSVMLSAVYVEVVVLILGLLFLAVWSSWVLGRHRRQPWVADQDGDLDEDELVSRLDRMGGVGGRS